MERPKKVTDRSKLGTFVITLGSHWFDGVSPFYALGIMYASSTDQCVSLLHHSTPGAGATFGEVALITEDSVRTASVVCDEHTDVIVIDRDLYNRSVKYVLEKEFEEKTDFIKSNPFFQNWAPKYKKQLAMAFEKIKFPYESAIIKQGNHVDAIYFILSGEVKIVVDTTMHHAQYPKLCPPDDAALDAHNGTHPASPGSPSIHRRTIAGESTGSDSPNLSVFRRKIGKKPLVDVCYLGVNECIGDTEVLLEMPSFSHSAICTQETEVLMLETKHYERLLVKRNPQAISAMIDSLELKLQHRINDKVALSQLLYQKTKEINDEVRRQSQARKIDHKKHAKVHNGSEAFIPTNGPLVDIFGPGTVFHRIRQREHSKHSKLKKDRSYNATMYNNAHSDDGNNVVYDGDGYLVDGDIHDRVGPSIDERYIDDETSDVALQDLENRMRDWLLCETNKTKTPRVTQLQRAPVEGERTQLKPGAKIVIRPKRKVKLKT